MLMLWHCWSFQLKFKTILQITGGLLKLLRDYFAILITIRLECDGYTQIDYLYFIYYDFTHLTRRLALSITIRSVPP